MCMLLGMLEKKRPSGGAGVHKAITQAGQKRDKLRCMLDTLMQVGGVCRE